MSDDGHMTVSIPAELAGQWWYFAGLLRAILNRKRQDDGSDDWQWMNSPNPGGCTLHIGPRRTRSLIAKALFVDKGDKTFLSINTMADNAPAFHAMVDELKAVAHEAASARRQSIGATFTEILDEFYARKARGERVRLKALADARDANYTNLRQAKVTYDRKRNKM